MKVLNEKYQMKQSLLSLLVFLLTAGVADAIPNPAAVFCHELGYEYEDGDCIFPDGSRCNAWHYYCKCDPNGIGCWPGNFSCDFPCGKLPCKEAGESVLVSECCEGLEQIPPTRIYDDDCNYTGMTGWLYLCSDCGNGICETWESKCNCPQDCNCLDTDSDSACDWADNCLYDYNPDQHDADDDGIGDVCDEDCPDLDGLKPVNVIDFSILAYDWQQTGTELVADIDGNGIVDINDLVILATYWLCDCRPP